MQMSAIFTFRWRTFCRFKNLMENLIWTIHNKQPNKRSIHQATMGLLLLQLMNYTDLVHVGKDNKNQELFDVSISLY